MKEVSKHELVDVVIELVGKEFLKPESGCRLLPIHPRAWFFSLIPKRGPNFSSHPFQQIVMLQNESIKPPHGINSLNWLSSIRKTGQSRSILFNQWINLRKNLLFLLSLFSFLLLFGLLLLESILPVQINQQVPLLTNCRIQQSMSLKSLPYNSERRPVESRQRMSTGKFQQWTAANSLKEETVVIEVTEYARAKVTTKITPILEFISNYIVY